MTQYRNDHTEESGAPATFAPDALLPEQFVGALRNHKGFVEGEKRLLAAVLADGVECYMKYVSATDNRGRQLFEDAEAWIFEDSAGGLFSFHGACEVLGLEPDWVRQGLVRWRRRVVKATGSGGDEAAEFLRAAS
jgi:hypothetical protein